MMVNSPFYTGEEVKTKHIKRPLSPIMSDDENDEYDKNNKQ